MKERIIEFLKAENKSSAQFAIEIGVQPSGISHIISGRNKPSLDFIIKMLEKYPYLSTDWLLFGKGNMMRNGHMPDVDNENLFKKAEDLFTGHENADIDSESKNVTVHNKPVRKIAEIRNTGISIERIILFYNDGSFIEYFPKGENSES